MPNKGTFALSVLVDAVRRRVEETSIRAVCDEIGMSHGGLHGLLRGTRPHPATREKLVEWYLERQHNRGDGPSSADVDAAMRLLIHHITQDHRVQVRERRAAVLIERLQAAVEGDD